MPASKVFVRHFDIDNDNWSEDSFKENAVFLQNVRNYAKGVFESQGHLFLNEVYDMLCMPRSREGAIYGWTAGSEAAAKYQHFDWVTQGWIDDLGITIYFYVDAIPVFKNLPEEVEYHGNMETIKKLRERADRQEVAQAYRCSLLATAELLELHEAKTLNLTKVSNLREFVEQMASIKVSDNGA